MVEARYRYTSLSVTTILASCPGQGVKLLLHTYLYMWDTEVCGVMGLPKVAMKASDLLASIAKITFCELLEPPINIDTTSKNFDGI